jgi:hypothetical protein
MIAPVKRLSRGSVKGGPAKLILRARGRVQLSERDRVDQQEGSGQETGSVHSQHVENGHAAEGRRHHSLGYRTRVF